MKVFIILTLSIAIEAFNPVLLVTFDGMRADKFDEFVKNNPNSAFSKFLKDGVKAEFMKPSFPTCIIAF
jgi:predicted AlkP superfamily pyrophosphatase or phosphodiesterase